MLHIINRFPVSEEMLANTSVGDTVVFTDNAVYAVKQSDADKDPLRKTYSHINLCVRKADLVLRNISSRELFKGVAVLDDFDYQSALNQNVAIKSWN